MNLVLDAGADPNVANLVEYTPLTRAAFYGKPEIVARLLESGADHCILHAALRREFLAIIATECASTITHRLLSTFPCVNTVVSFCIEQQCK